MDAVSVDSFILSAKESDHAETARNRGRSVEEVLEGLLRVYKDGSVERFGYVVPASDSAQHPVASKDAILDSRTGVWARFYVPRKALSSRGSRLPLLIYFHGGGFVLGSPAWSVYHVFMCRMASETNCMIVSVGYRLAPEHRLPAAYEDCFSAVEWVRRQAVAPQSHDSWLTSYADFSRCCLAGDSAGGNIAHHVALRCAHTDMKPLEIRGAILLQPFFGGEIASKWEIETCDPNLSQRWIEVFWKLALPVGSKRDHPACNPLVSKLADVKLPPILVCISEKDVLKQRNMEYCQALKNAGKNASQIIIKDVGHAFQVLNPDSSRIPELIKVLHDFINNRNPSK